MLTLEQYCQLDHSPHQLHLKCRSGPTFDLPLNGKSGGASKPSRRVCCTMRVAAESNTRDKAGEALAGAEGVGTPCPLLVCFVMKPWVWF